MKLGELTRVWECSEKDPPDEDTTLIARIGSPATVGKVVEDRDRKGIYILTNYICIKPLDKNQLLPRYLYYAMQYVYNEGHWRRVGTPLSGGKAKIRVSDVKEVSVRRT